MQTGFFIAGVAGRTAEKKMDVVAHNLANATTPGFVGSHMAFRTTLTDKLALYSHRRMTPGAYASEGSSFVDLSPGAPHPTGNPLDFAIVGDGWFKVQVAPGKIAYTRAGNFKLDENGNLLTMDGKPVLDDADAPIVLPPSTQPNGELAADNNGNLFVDKKQVAKLGIVHIQDASKIRRLGHARVFTPVSNTEPAGADVAVHQGQLTGSNVNSVMTMVEMMTITRNHQGLMKLIEQYNHVASLLSEQVGRVQG